jgi:competence protein ComEC
MSRLHLFCIVASGILGLAVGQDFVVPGWSLAATASLAIVCSANSRCRIIALMVLCCVFGMWRMMSVKSIQAHDISRFAGSEVTLRGVIVQPSTVDGTAQRVVLTELVIRDQQQVGAILVSLPAIPVVPTSARIALTCTVNTLTSTSVQRQWSHGIHARCATLRFRIVEQSVTSWRAVLGRWQERVLMYVRRNYNEPQASLLNGILIGNTDGMPDRLNHAFQATGTTHIVALSGFNVTIIMAIVVGWMVRIVGRRWAWIPALGLLIAFVVTSGASASVVRAAVISLMYQSCRSKID